VAVNPVSSFNSRTAACRMVWSVSSTLRLGLPMMF
jgi:hypothetical protein